MLSKNYRYFLKIRLDFDISGKHKKVKSNLKNSSIINLDNKGLANSLFRKSMVNYEQSRDAAWGRKTG